jgi:CheY-specific phosphatase CheX
MKEATEKVLAKVAGEVLEGLAFLSPDPGAMPQIEPARTATATVRFRGPFSGQLTLTVPHEMLAEIAANMLGLDCGEQCSEQAKADALGELANVICGNLVAAVSAPTEVFDLEKPEVTVVDRCEQGEEAQQGGGLRTVLAVEDGWVEVALSFAEDSRVEAAQRTIAG